MAHKLITVIQPKYHTVLEYPQLPEQYSSRVADPKPLEHPPGQKMIGVGKVTHRSKRTLPEYPGVPELSE